MTAPKPRQVFRNPQKRTELINTFRALRTLKIAGEKRWPGQLVPEAHTWLRVGNFTHTGYLKEVQVPEAEFDAAVADFCPGLTEVLASKAKGTPVASSDDTKFTGFQTDENGQVIDVAARRRFEREVELANTAPNDRVATDRHAQGTPEAREQNSPEGFHSDGGPTLWQEPEEGGFAALTDPDEATKVVEAHEKSSDKDDSYDAKHTDKTENDKANEKSSDSSSKSETSGPAGKLP